MGILSSCLICGNMLWQQQKITQASFPFVFLGTFALMFQCLECCAPCCSHGDYLLIMKATAFMSHFQKGLPWPLYLKQCLPNPQVHTGSALFLSIPSMSTKGGLGKELTKQDKLLKKSCTFSEGPPYYVTGSWSASGNGGLGSVLVF